MAIYLDVCRGCGAPRNHDTTGTFVNYRGERVLRSRCKECTNAYVRGWRRVTPVYESVKVKAKEDYARRKAADPQLNKWRDLRRHYGITREQFEDLIAAQEGRCAACGGVPDLRGLEVDHCHQAGHVRSLLCGTCNRALGMVDDSIERLESLIAYLRRAPMIITNAPEL